MKLIGATQRAPVFSGCSVSVSHTDTVCAVVSMNGTILDKSIGFQDIFSHSQENSKGTSNKNISDFFKEMSWEKTQSAALEFGHIQYETWIETPQNLAEPYMLQCMPVLNSSDNTPAFFVFATPTDPLGDEKRDLIKSAYYDPLTGLHNRRYLDVSIGDFLDACEAGSVKMGVMVVDVDDFKSVNDRFGHNTGDKAIQHIAQAIENAVPLGDTVVRYGGDEFLIIIQDLFEEDDLDKISNEIHTEISRPFLLGDNQLRLEVSIGSSIFPDQGSNLQELIDRADSDMYRNKQLQKRGGADRVTPKPCSSTSRNWKERLTTENPMIRLKPVFQPIVNLKSREASGVEVLCRWHHEDGHISMPDEFIPVAEEQFLISKIDNSILRLTDKCYQLEDLPPPPNLNFFFNVSALTLNDPDFIDFFKRFIRNSTLQTENMCFELTESVTLIDESEGRKNLWEIHNAGCQIALDDFGTGFSSFSLLKDLPISKIKIDKSFVSGILSSERDQQIVGSILHLCDSLGYDSVAEGIESQEQANLLTSMGATLGQGYYFGRPSSLSNATKGLSGT